MTIEEILHIGKGLDAVDPGEEQSRRDFADACRRVDSARIEQQRIRDLADSIDEGDARYQRAIVALEEGNFVSAEPLLRWAADAGIGEATYLLAGLLEKRGKRSEAIEYYWHPHFEGDTRATTKLPDFFSS
jgi:hypothetical protein